MHRCPAQKAANGYTQPVHIRRFAALRGMGRTFRRLCAGTLRGRSPAGVPQRGHAVRPAFRIRRAPRQRQKADPSQPEKAGLHKKAASATDGEAAFL